MVLASLHFLVLIMALDSGNLVIKEKQNGGPVLLLWATTNKDLLYVIVGVVIGVIQGYCIYSYQDWNSHWEIWTTIDDNSTKILDDGSTKDLEPQKEIYHKTIIHSQTIQQQF